MGDGKEEWSSVFDRKDRRKRMRESGSQTDEEDYVASTTLSCSTDARLEKMNEKLDRVLSACQEIESLKSEIIELRNVVKTLKDSLDTAQENINQLQTELAETMASVKDNSESIDDIDADIEALKRRNIRLEAYTRRENIRIYNVEEVAEEKTEEVVRNLLVRNLKIPVENVKAIRFERVHRISTSKTKQGSQRRPRSIIARFSHYQDKELVHSFLKNLKGTDIGISDDFPREVEEIHKELYPVLKKAKRDQRKAFFNFDKLIIDGQIYRGKETKKLPFYGNIMRYSV